jgi:serine/threonine-protein kinase OSR1/STK39
MWTKGKKSGLLAPRGRKREFPIRAADYELLEPIGDGATAVVRRARCLPLGGEVVAVKIMNMAHRTESDVVRTPFVSLVTTHQSLIIY